MLLSLCVARRTCPTLAIIKHNGMSERLILNGRLKVDLKTSRK